MSWQPAWQLLVAFNNSAFDDPTAISSVASPPGTLGGHNVWTDITADLRTQADTNRGKQHELDHAQTGTFTFTLDNRSGWYDPWNTSSPYTGLIAPGKPVRLQATSVGGGYGLGGYGGGAYSGATYALFTGLTDVWASQWTAENYGTVAVSCVDLFAYLQNMYINNPAFYVSLVAGNANTVGPTHLWRFSEPPGTPTIVDQVGIGGVVNADPHKTTWASVAGPLVTDMLPGANLAPNNNTPSAFFTIPPMPQGADVTLELWTLHSSAPAATSFLWQQGYASPSGTLPGPAVWVNVSGQPGFYDGSGTVHTAAKSIADGSWHHLVLTINSTSGVWTLYVDSVSAVSAGSTTGLPFVSPYGIVGSGSWPDIGPGGCYGSIANVATYIGIMSGVQILADFQAADLPVESSGARVTRIAHTLMGVTLGPVDTGNALLEEPTQGQQVLSYLQNVEDSERGLLFVGTDGRLIFRSRGTVYGNTTSTVTFGDGGGSEIPFELNPQIAVDTQDVYEQVQLARTGGVTQTAGTITGAFGARTYQNTGLVNSTDLEVAGMATWLLNQFATPTKRIRQIVIHAISDNTGAATAALLGMEIGTVVTVNRHNMPGGGTGFSQVGNVEGINFHIYPDTGDWNVELQITPLAPMVPWILGTSLLGTNTVLFF